jgi:hypothetical protein
MPRESTLDGEARLEERKRPENGMLINAEPVAFGAQRSADTVKGGIARAPSLLSAVGMGESSNVFETDRAALLPRYSSF